MYDYFDGDTIQSLLSVNSYRDISEKVLIKLLQKRGLNVQDFQAWKERCETSFHDRKNISVPFLLITSANDPLHHAAMIGIPLRDEDHAANVAYLVTEQGGHVGWGEITAEGFSRSFPQKLPWVFLLPPSLILTEIILIYISKNHMHLMLSKLQKQHEKPISIFLAVFT